MRCIIPVHVAFAEFEETRPEVVSEYLASDIRASWVLAGPTVGGNDRPAPCDGRTSICSPGV
jgi:hypothetical protein